MKRNGWFCCLGWTEGVIKHLLESCYPQGSFHREDYLRSSWFMSIIRISCSEPRPFLGTWEGKWYLARKRLEWWFVTSFKWWWTTINNHPEKNITPKKISENHWNWWCTTPANYHCESFKILDHCYSLARKKSRLTDVTSVWRISRSSFFSFLISVLCFLSKWKWTRSECLLSFYNNRMRETWTLLGSLFLKDSLGRCRHHLRTPRHPCWPPGKISNLYRKSNQLLPHLLLEQ